ncbi:MAG: DNA repair protein RecO [Atopobiaceae bacterium]|nr:DNA repair protein RecO [Atopobiaceae bacterium]
MPGRRSKRCRAIVLDRTKLREQDLILTTLSLGGEQLRAVAKGARKPGSRLAASTGLFCDVDLLVSEGRGLPIVTEAQLIKGHAGLCLDLDALSCASAICEVARMTCYEDVEDPFLHPLLARTLDACDQAIDRAHLDAVYAAYTFKVLSHCGWRPVLNACVSCGEQGGTRFCTQAGGILCESCAKDVEGATPIEPWQIEWIGALVGLTFDQIMDAEIDQLTAGFLASVAHEWAVTHLDCRLRASEFFTGA